MVRDLSPLFDAILQLKRVNRAGWEAKAGIKDPESVADHTFSMCAVGMTLADMMGLDTKKAMKMIILHDLAESVVGDYMPGEVSSEKKATEENMAMKKILSYLPAKVKKDYEKTWQEYMQNKSKMARFVHRIDKLEMALQAAKYAKDGYPRESLAQFFHSARKVVAAEDDILTEIMDSL